MIVLVHVIVIKRTLIFVNGINALQQAESLRNYLLRKMSISVAENSADDLFMWNPLPFAVDEIRELNLRPKKQALNYEM